MNFIASGKHISVDHISIGSRRSGSWWSEDPIGTIDHLSGDAQLQDWAASAADGDTHSLGCGLFLTCWGSK